MNVPFIIIIRLKLVRLLDVRYGLAWLAVKKEGDTQQQQSETKTETQRSSAH